jgi:hypothetical protein
MFEQQLTQFPQNPPRALHALPGLRVAAMVPKTALFLPLIFVRFFFSMPFSILHSNPGMRLSWGPSRNVSGVVVSVDAASCRGVAARRIIYSFAPTGHEFRGSAVQCAGALYYSVGAGDTVQIRYLASDPSVNALQGMPDNARPVALFLVMPLFFLLLLAQLFVPQLRELLLARRVLKHGRLATGSVVYVRKRSATSWPGWPGAGAYAVYVEFASPAGGRREAVAWCANEWLVNQLAPGAAVHVAYSDQKPARVALLEAFLR